MHKIVQNLIDIENRLKSSLGDVDQGSLPKIIAVSKTFKMDKISPLVEHGHLDFGENKVQEAIDKWTEIKVSKPNIQLHMIGKLQTNKVKFAVKLFDYIHSVDSEKLAKKIADEQLKVNRNIKVFIQVNIGDENQKSGINIDEINNLAEIHDSTRFLGHIPKVQLVKGDATKTIPKFIKTNPHIVVSLLFLDFDLYKPTKTALMIKTQTAS